VGTESLERKEAARLISVPL